MPPDFFSDPAMRALVAAVMVSDAPEDLRVPCVAAAWAVDGPLGIAPAAVAAGQRDDRADDIIVARESSADELGQLKRTYQEDAQKLKEQFEAKLKASQAAKLAATRKEKAEKELNRCAEAFLAAVSQLETDQGKGDADLLVEISKNVSALQAWVAEQQASGGAASKPPRPSPPAPPPSVTQGATSSSTAAQSAPPPASASTSGTAGDAGKKKS
jgi:Skp family chaperone for outer membrane proteins